MKRAIAILAEKGPMLTGELANLLQQRYNITNEAARKIISRAKSPVQKICSLSFESNQMFCYLETQFMTAKYTGNLLNAIENHSKVNFLYINALLRQGGYISKDVLPAFTASPIKKIRGHKLHQRVIDDLTKNKLLRDYDDERLMLGSDFFSENERSLEKSMGIEAAKKIILGDFYGWARSVNLVGYGTGRIFSEKPEFANFQWGFTAPSYIQPLCDLVSGKPGFVIADVCLNKSATAISAQDVCFFVEKIEIIRSYKKLPRFLPVLLVDSVSEETLALLKRNRVMVAFLGELFSEKYMEALRNIMLLFENATTIITKNPNLIQKVFDDIASLEGKYNNIVGDLFEFLVGAYFQEIGCSTIEMKKQAVSYEPEGRRHKEIDVFVSRNGKYIVAECKAIRSPVDDEYIERWLHENIPFIRKWINTQNDSRPVEFQIWSVGGFSNKAIDLLNKEKSSTKKYEISYFDYTAMMELARMNGAKTFPKTLSQHYSSFRQRS